MCILHLQCVFSRELAGSCTLPGAEDAFLFCAGLQTELLTILGTISKISTLTLQRRKIEQCNSKLELQLDTSLKTCIFF